MRHALLDLQAVAGNQAVCRLVNGQSYGPVRSAPVQRAPTAVRDSPGATPVAERDPGAEFIAEDPIVDLDPAEQLLKRKGTSFDADTIGSHTKALGGYELPVKLKHFEPYLPGPVEDDIEVVEVGHNRYRAWFALGSSPEYRAVSRIHVPVAPIEGREPIWFAPASGDEVRGALRDWRGVPGVDEALAQVFDDEYLFVVRDPGGEVYGHVLPHELAHREVWRAAFFGTVVSWAAGVKRRGQQHDGIEFWSPSPSLARAKARRRLFRAVGGDKRRLLRRLEWQLRRGNAAVDRASGFRMRRILVEPSENGTPSVVAVVRPQ